MPGWYLGLMGGGAFMQDSSLSGGGSYKGSFRPGWVGSGFGGYDFGAWRLEAELAHRANGLRALSGKADGTVSSSAVMGNVIYGLPLDSPLRPYLGAGAGAAYVDWSKAKREGADYINDSAAAFAYQGILGVGYELTPSLGLNLDYRYFATTDAGLSTQAGQSVEAPYRNHAVMAGFTWKFGAPPANRYVELAPPPATASSAHQPIPPLTRLERKLMKQALSGPLPRAAMGEKDGFALIQRSDLWMLVSPDGDVVRLTEDGADAFLGGKPLARAQIQGIQAGSFDPWEGLIALGEKIPLSPLHASPTAIGFSAASALATEGLQGAMDAAGVKIPLELNPVYWMERLFAHNSGPIDPDRLAATLTDAKTTAQRRAALAAFPATFAEALNKSESEAETKSILALYAALANRQPVTAGMALRQLERGDEQAAGTRLAGQLRAEQMRQGVTGAKASIQNNDAPRANGPLYKKNGRMHYALEAGGLEQAGGSDYTTQLGFTSTGVEDSHRAQTSRSQALGGSMYFDSSSGAESGYAGSFLQLGGFQTRGGKTHVSQGYTIEHPTSYYAEGTVGAKFRLPTETTISPFGGMGHEFLQKKADNHDPVYGAGISQELRFLDNPLVGNLGVDAYARKSLDARSVASLRGEIRAFSHMTFGDWTPGKMNFSVNLLQPGYFSIYPVQLLHLRYTAEETESVVAQLQAVYNQVSELKYLTHLDPKKPMLDSDRLRLESILDTLRDYLREYTLLPREVKDGLQACVATADRATCYAAERTTLILQINETRRLAKYSKEALQRSATVRPDSVNFSDRTPELANAVFKNSRVETLNAPRALVAQTAIYTANGGVAFNLDLNQFFDCAECTYSGTVGPGGQNTLVVNANGTITGTPNFIAETGNNYVFTVTATNKAGSASVTVRISVP
ncbi:MAG: outer membrane beta-barrel protein [Alphaproteobacteria bacterium]|nr:outer membrane beta-barrel protein [Alphaproteobacteria bacterium]